MRKKDHRPPQQEMLPLETKVTSPIPEDLKAALINALSDLLLAAAVGAHKREVRDEREDHV